MNKQISKITSNPIGAVVGGVAVFYAAKKFGGVSNKWLLIGATLVGVVAGATTQSAMAAKKSTPKASTTK